MNSISRKITKCLNWFNSLDSPVLVKELRLRMRGGKAYVIMGIYVILLGLLACGYYMFKTDMFSIGSSNTAPVNWMTYSEIGHEMFILISMLQLSMVILTAPSLTCGAITLEKEQQTFTALALTSIGSRTIILGKYFSSLCYLGLLIIASIPVMSLTLVFGGVSPGELFMVFAIILLSALLFGSIGIFTSSIVKRTYISTALAYGFMLFIIVGIPSAAFFVLGMLFFGGLGISAILTAFAHWLFPRMRPGWKPERVVYIAIFGFSFCAITALIHLPIAATIGNFLQSNIDILNPYMLLFYRGFNMGNTSSIPTFVDFIVSSVTFAILAFMMTLTLLLASIALLRKMRAPVPDTLEVEERYYDEMIKLETMRRLDESIHAVKTEKA